MSEKDYPASTTKARLNTKFMKEMTCRMYTELTFWNSGQGNVKCDENDIKTLDKEKG